MSREIKFRAWNTRDKEMIILENSGLQYFDFEGGYSLGFTVDGYYDFYAHEQYDTMSETASKFPIMQYTGLKDRNGKDIYEGDIVRWGTGKEDDFDREYQHRYAVVKFDPDIQFHIQYYIHSENGSRSEGNGKIFRYGNFAYRDTHLYLEILGNIHENPELL